LYTRIFFGTSLSATVVRNFIETPVTYKDLLNIDDISQLTENEQIDVIGNLFDFSFDNQNIEGLNKSFQLIEQIQIDRLSEVNKTVLFYDISNGWSYLRKLKYFKTSEAWSFQMEELSNEIYYLRKAISSSGFNEVQKERQCQILTNLGNSFSFIGRFVEAQVYWDRAIEILPLFSMAIGNKGYGMFHYGQILFDDSHKAIFFNHSYCRLPIFSTFQKKINNFIFYYWTVAF
jgi:tetratricopeptide (TPR) repeat protein